MKHSFTIEYSKYYRNSLIEILKDGKPFFEDIPGHKKPFIFGVKKAKMIVKCVKIIRDFYTSGGKKPSREENSGYTIKHFKGFEKEEGVRIDKPYLSIFKKEDIKKKDSQDIQNHPATLNFGLLKAKALDYCFKEIKAFSKKSW